MKTNDDKVHCHTYETTSAGIGLGRISPRARTTDVVDVRHRDYMLTQQKACSLILMFVLDLFRRDLLGKRKVTAVGNR